eukprot:421986-Amphidinium_carterae.1
MIGMHLFFNSFSGSLPGEGLAALKSIRLITLGYNKFRGALPHFGLTAMSRLYVFWIQSNAFAGTLPDEGFRSHTWEGVNVESNRLEGQLPESAVRFAGVKYVAAGDTRIEGAIPRSLGVTQCAVLKGVSFRRLALQGNIPPALSRMSCDEASLVLGHDLIGPLPPIAATLLAISGFGNKLEGHLPALEFYASQSAVVLHNNHFS